MSKIEIGAALFAELSAMQYAYESRAGRKNAENQELFRQAAKYMPIVKMSKGVYYRARIINDYDGEDTGIIRDNGIPISGYNSQYSGVAPENMVKENGRANRKGESVLYIAEDEETSCKEQKTQEMDYISVAECIISNDIKLMDFTVNASEGLDNIFAEDVIQLFHYKYDMDIRALYIFICNYFSSPNFKDMDYAVTLNFLDIVKQRKDISGAKYYSYYTKKYNIALWDKNKFSICTNSKVRAVLV